MGFSVSAGRSPSATFLDSLVGLKNLRPDSWYLIAAATSTTLGHGASWMPAIYQHAVKPLGPAPTNPTPPPVEFEADMYPRRKIVRRMKEALVKSAILSGVPRAIQSSIALKDALELGDKDNSCVREGLDFGEESARRGYDGRYKVYRDPSPFGPEVVEAMKDIEWISLHVTYGTFLAPCAELTPAAPLTFAESEIITLACLLSQRAYHETTWHLTGCLRNGLTPDEVESVQSAIEMVAAECGVDVKAGMPRVQDVPR